MKRINFKPNANWNQVSKIQFSFVCFLHRTLHIPLEQSRYICIWMCWARFYCCCRYLYWAPNWTTVCTIYQRLFGLSVFTVLVVQHSSRYDSMRWMSLFTMVGARWHAYVDTFRSIEENIAITLYSKLHNIFYQKKFSGIRVELFG